jgi:crotonobetainyl-CoA:carnitine CoA-transferase CaiB-like acyl-CoA transferase
MVVGMEHAVAGPLRMLGLPIELSETPASIRHEPPALGANTDAVLAELGYSPEEIADLRVSGVV